MADLNEVRLIGRLTRDPVTKTFSSGSSLTTFGLATGRKYKDQSGGLKEETTFVEINCWGKLGEVVAKYMKKGRSIYVGGRLKYESWDDKQTGQKRNRLTVNAEDVQFLDSRREETTQPEAIPVDVKTRQPGDDGEETGSWPIPDESNPF